MRTDHSENDPHAPVRTGHDPLVDMGYESQDINYRSLFKGTMWFFGFAVFSFVAAIMIFRFVFPTALGVKVGADRPFSNQVPASPNPLLQTNVTTKTDIKDLRVHEEEMLTTTGWVDQAKGVVRIPVDRAIQLTAERTSNATPASIRNATIGATSPGTTTGPQSGSPAMGQQNAGRPQTASSLAPSPAAQNGRRPTPNAATPGAGNHPAGAPPTTATGAGR